MACDLENAEGHAVKISKTLLMRRILISDVAGQNRGQFRGRYPGVWVKNAVPRKHPHHRLEHLRAGMPLASVIFSLRRTLLHTFSWVRLDSSRDAWFGLNEDQDRHLVCLALPRPHRDTVPNAEMVLPSEHLARPALWVPSPSTLGNQRLVTSN